MEGRGLETVETQQPWAEQRSQVNPTLQKSCTLKDGQGGVVRKPLAGIRKPRSVRVTQLTCCGTSGTNTLGSWSQEMDKDAMSVPGLGSGPNLIRGWSLPSGKGDARTWRGFIVGCSEQAPYLPPQTQVLPKPGPEPARTGGGGCT